VVALRYLPFVVLVVLMDDKRSKSERRQCCGSCRRWQGDDEVTHGDCGKQPDLTTEWSDGVGCDYYARWQEGEDDVRDD